MEGFWLVKIACMKKLEVDYIQGSVCYHLVECVLPFSSKQLVFCFRTQKYKDCNTLQCNLACTLQWREAWCANLRDDQ